MIREFGIQLLKFRVNMRHIRCVLADDAVFRAATAEEKVAIARRRDRVVRKYHAAQLELALLEKQERSGPRTPAIDPSAAESMRCTQRSATDAMRICTAPNTVPRTSKSDPVRWGKIK